ncbi:hypothetical protein [Pseudomonas citrulli]|uniref:Uncharacterized protein n=1 Tax=Pseudomonas citrulli TaxID=3064347 RepID=A0ABT9C645_9PSED|nr:hypothetical protein [Pseudomonas sp. K18]MDO7900288.1 hypothetical protein [Pseudomonas sp. K18]
MNPIKAIFFSLLLTGNLIYSINAFSQSSTVITNDESNVTETANLPQDRTLAAAQPEQSKTTGTLILRDHENGICRLFLPGPGTTDYIYNFNTSAPPCQSWNDRTRSIQLAEVPSATTILLSDQNNCDQSNFDNSWVLMRTTKKQTNSTIIETEYLMAYQKKQIIEPGLQMIDSRLKAANFRDKISCIKVTTSAQPPAPSATTP